MRSLCYNRQDTAIGRSRNVKLRRLFPSPVQPPGKDLPATPIPVSGPGDGHGTTDPVASPQSERALESPEVPASVPSDAAVASAVDRIRITLGDRQFFARLPLPGAPPLIDAVLDHLITLGFERARFYDIAYNRSRRREMVVLTAFRPTDDPDAFLGLSVGFDEYERLMGISPDKLDEPKVAAGDQVLAAETDGSWVDTLSLRDRCWIDIPLYIAGRLIGIIACDWRGRPDDLSRQDVADLQLLASQVAGYKALGPVESVDSAIRKIDALPLTDPPKLLHEVLRILVEALGAAIGAAFEYSWDSAQLRKVDEYHHPQLHVPPELKDFPEKYDTDPPDGKPVLTARAWTDPDARYIADFEDLQDASAWEASPPSVERHTLLLKRLQTVMYLVAGRLERRYLIRLINRIDSPRLPFIIPGEKINELERHVSDVVDDCIARARLQRFQEFAQLSAAQVNAPEQIVAAVGAALAAEGANDWMLASFSSTGSNGAALTDGGRRKERSSGFTYIRSSGSLFADWVPPSDFQPNDDPTYARATASGKPSLLLVSDGAPHSSGRLTSLLAARQVAATVAFPFRGRTTVGAIFLPVHRLPRASTGQSLTSTTALAPSQVEAVTAYAAIAGSAIENSSTFLTVEGARKLVGYIGHEIQSPASKLMQNGLAALSLAKSVLRGNKATPDQFAALTEREGPLKEAAATLRERLDIALSISLTSRGTLHLHIEPHSLSDVLSRAHLAVQADLRLLTRRPVEFILPSTTGFDGLNCDRPLLVQAFINLFRNAVKYSFPREKNAPCYVTVTAEAVADDEVVVRITNWGIGIPRDVMGRIFEPFVRGEVVDRVKAIRGMGLGLYIVRLIVEGHDGRVKCNYSKETWGDKRRTSAMEGFETQFEVRLARNLPTGTRAYQFAPEGAPS